MPSNYNVNGYPMDTEAGRPFLTSLSNGSDRSTENASDEQTSLPDVGEYTKSMIYGGLDAIVSSFSLVAAISGGNLSAGTVLVLGFANLIADGMSQGLGHFVSSTAERDLFNNCRKDTTSKICKDPHDQIMNLVSAYMDHGMTERDAKMVVDCFSKYKPLLVNQKMSMEQGTIPPDPSEGNLWKHGCLTFGSFIGFGSIPLLAYVIMNPFTTSTHLKFAVACIVTAATLVVLGLAKARISGQRYLNSVMMVLLNGGFVAGVAYFFGWLLNNLLHLGQVPETQPGT